MNNTNGHHGVIDNTNDHSQSIECYFQLTILLITHNTKQQ